jgi:hypothetical protein
VDRFEKNSLFGAKKREADLSEPAPFHPLPKLLGIYSSIPLIKAKFIEKPLRNINRDIKTAMFMPTVLNSARDSPQKKRNSILNNVL